MSNETGTATLNGVVIAYEWRGTPDEGRIHLFWSIEGHPIATAWELEDVMESDVAEKAGGKGAPTHAGWWIFDGFYQDTWADDPAGPFEALARELLLEKLHYLRKLDLENGE